MQAWRWRVTADAWSDHHWQSGTCEICHCLVNVFMWQLFPDGLQGNFQPWL